MILIVEDDRVILECLQLALPGEGFETLAAGSVKEALRLFDKEQDRLEMVLLDITLPDGTGYDICRCIREKSDIPILFLTACDDEVHTVLALEQGADDYVPKPFHIRELTARIRAVLRRTGRMAKTVIRVKENEINLSSGKVYRNGTEAVLSAMEYKLLLVFVQNIGVLMSRDRLLDLLYDEVGEYVNDNTLTVYIKRLRAKLGDDVIETVRGIGYRMER